ncbi:glycosyltransferase involved in cell wall biosynthesis [Desulfitispora alkaliphila]|uniref:glycosyltransferase family 2 protein n=1 Tax=Desulfitispora alkaliphila TaxID=622674 RepID=UPI003D1FFF5E
MGVIKISKKFSVIIPTYNRAEQLLLTLTSFNLQTYKKDEFEVIVVDDASTDNTKEVVTDFRASYNLVYTNTGINSGRSHARNQGISLAKGQHLIFCDSDFIVCPEFIQIFHDYHRKYRNTIISGIPNAWEKAYTQYYSGFNDQQKQEMHHMLEPIGLWKESFWGEEDNNVPLLKPEDINKNFHIIEKHSPPLNISKRLERELRKTDVAPWMLFITRCVSVKRGYVNKVGGFDTNFVKWGLEDWELGYRLNKLGLSFISINKKVGYHQEHPYNKKNKLDETAINLCHIYKRHGFSDPELTALSVYMLDIIPYKANLRKYMTYIRKGYKTKAKQLESKWRKKAIDFYNKHEKNKTLENT